MSNDQELSAELAEAHQQLHNAQARVAELEALVTEISTKRKETETMLERYAQRMEILHLIDKGIINARSIQEIVSTALKHIRVLIPGQQAIVILFDFPADEIIIFAVDENTPSPIIQGNRVPMPPDTFEEFGVDTISRIDDLPNVPESSSLYQRMKLVGMQASLRTALLFQNDPIGRLILNADQPGVFTLEHQEIALEISTQLAIAIRQMRLAEDIERHTGELEQKVVARTADLTDAKAHVEAILNNGPDCILFIEADLSIEQANLSFNRLFQCESDDYFGKSLISLIHVEDAQAVTALVQAAITEQDGSDGDINIGVGLGDGANLNGEKHIEVRAVRKDDTIFDAELRIRAIEGDGLVCTIRDISERKAQERQLRYHASLQENVSDAVIVTDTAFRIQSWNKAAERIYGWRAEEVTGLASATILETEYTSNTDQEQAIQELQRQGWWHGEVIQHHKDGSNLHILGSVTLVKDNKGLPFGVVAVNHDISERKQAEIALKASEEKYRALVETMRGGMVIFDREGKITFINDRMHEILGYSHEEVVGTVAADYVDKAHLPVLKAQLERRRHLESSSYELLFRHKSGKPVYLLVAGSPLLGKQGESIGSFAVMTDISAQKQAEEALRQALAKEKELGELKSRFVSMASHEFRTPLATMLALTETLSAYRHRLPDDQIDEKLGKIMEQVSHLRDTMDDVLMLARMQTQRVEFNPVRLNPDALCRSVIDEFQSRDDVRSRLVYTCHAEPHEISLDRKLMRHILINLLSNALKYSPETEIVTVTLEYSLSDLILTVQDKGIGIPEADLPHLFEPFHRAANVGTISGTGLGLVITREAVELHHGAITVATQLGAGTTFTVRIPIVTEGKNAEAVSSPD